MARLQTSSHNFIHFLNLKPILQEFQSLKRHYNEIKHLRVDPSYQHNLNNYFKIIEHYITSINDDLSNYQLQRRQKRGLINGLGSIIKQITGNMDAEDENKLQAVIEQIKSNQKNIAHQLTHQYTINKEIMEKFNKTVDNIQRNEKIIYDRIDFYIALNKNNSNSIEQLLMENTLNQITHLFAILSNILRNIKDSINFCKAGIIHTTTISHEELMKELNKLNHIYHEKIPFKVNHNTVQTYINLIKPTCHIVNEEAIYILNLPLFDPRPFQLFYLLPTPNIHYQMILPSVRYILKFNSELKPLLSLCEVTNDIYLCPKTPNTLLNVTCEAEILNGNNPESCSYIQVKEEKSLEFIPEINQFLGIFPQTTSVEVNCQSTWNRQRLKGIFLFDFNNQCQTFVESTALEFNSTIKTQAVPLEYNAETPKKIIQDLPRLQLKNLQLARLTENIQTFEPTYDDGVQPWHLSSTILLYLVLLIVVAILGYRRFTRPRPSEGLTSDPGTAKF